MKTYVSQVNELISRQEMSHVSVERVDDLQLDITRSAFEIFPETKKSQKIHQNLHQGYYILRHGTATGHNTG